MQGQTHIKHLPIVFTTAIVGLFLLSVLNDPLPIAPVAIQLLGIWSSLHINILGIRWSTGMLHASRCLALQSISLALPSTPV